MSDNPKLMKIGPSVTDQEMTKGDCPDCGLQCSPECGIHPLDCFYGGFGYGYWIYNPACELDHGERGDGRE
jgi:hypothetical protein